MMVVMAGASGFLGTAMRAALAAEGHRVVQLVRRPPSGPDQHRWRPEEGELDAAILGGADAVVNLAGAGVEDQRWTDTYKRTLLASRLDTTATLADAMAGLPANRRPAVLLNASGVHIYGDNGDNPVDERTPAGSGMYLTDLCPPWEAATEPAREAGVRVVKLRTGAVLDRRGGQLKTQSLLFKLFAGGNLASGKQWMPWISLRDWVAAGLFLIKEDVEGPVNLVGPAPVRNEDFTRALAAALHRPALIPAPAFALRAALGQFGREALASLRVLPHVLTERGFPFQDTTVESAIRAGLQKSPTSPPRGSTAS